MIKLTNLLKETLTEVSVEQLKTQFVDSGKISQEDFNGITSATSKTAYITWLAKKVADKIIKAEDIYKYKKYFSIFDRRKKEYPFNDINQYKTSDDLSQFIKKSVEISNKESEDVSQQKGVSKTDKYKEFYIGIVDGFNVYELPKGRKDLYGASCELGSGTEWCTATGKTREHFDSYISKGPLFIFLKPGSSEKYQFNYETNSFMNEDDLDVFAEFEDSEVEYTDILNLFKFIESKKPKYKTPLVAKLMSSEPIASEDLIIKGDVDLNRLNIKSLPPGLKIGGDLKLSNTEIESLPSNLEVKQILWLNGTPIQNLPNDLKVGGLMLSDSDISSLPPNLEIDGDLNLNSTKIKTLSYGLKVGGDLYLIYSDIKSISPDLKVGGNLYLRDTPLSEKYTEEQLKQMLPGVKGEIVV